VRDGKDDRQSDLQYIINDPPPTIKGPGVDHGMLTGLQDHQFLSFYEIPNHPHTLVLLNHPSVHAPSLIEFMAIPHLLHTSLVLILPDSIQ